MAHSMEVCLQMTIIISGAAIGFYSGDVRKLVTEDLPALQPTIMAGRGSLPPSLHSCSPHHGQRNRALHTALP